MQQEEGASRSFERHPRLTRCSGKSWCEAFFLLLACRQRKHLHISHIHCLASASELPGWACSCFPN